jgi:hypothetical protein
MTRLVTRTRKLSAVGLFAASMLLHVVALRSVPEPARRVDGAGLEPESVDFEVGTAGAGRAPEPTAAVPEAELVLPGAQRRAAQREQPTDRPADNTNGDEAGARGRRVIEQYMRENRENLPLGSAPAFPETQLAELNLNRAQREAFDPYGAGLGGSRARPSDCARISPAGR